MAPLMPLAAAAVIAATITFVLALLTVAALAVQLVAHARAVGLRVRQINAGYVSLADRTKAAGAEHVVILAGAVATRLGVLTGAALAATFTLVTLGD